MEEGWKEGKDKGGKEERRKEGRKGRRKRQGRKGRRKEWKNSRNLFLFLFTVRNFV